MQVLVKNHKYTQDTKQYIVVVIVVDIKLISVTVAVLKYD